MSGRSSASQQPWQIVHSGPERRGCEGAGRLARKTAAVVTPVSRLGVQLRVGFGRSPAPRRPCGSSSSGVTRARALFSAKSKSSTRKNTRSPLPGGALSALIKEGCSCAPHRWRQSKSATRGVEQRTVYSWSIGAMLIGNARTRIRDGSNVTMLPLSRASASCGRFETIARASASGWRLPRPRNCITEGF